MAITKHRMTSITKSAVVFNYKDYKDGDQQKSMELPVGEFLRRFEQHFLPSGFVKIRHFGFLQNHGKTTRLNAVRAVGFSKRANLLATISLLVSVVALIKSFL